MFLSIKNILYTCFKIIKISFIYSYLLIGVFLYIILTLLLFFFALILITFKAFLKKSKKDIDFFSQNMIENNLNILQKIFLIKYFENSILSILLENLVKDFPFITYFKTRKIWYYLEKQENDKLIQLLKKRPLKLKSLLEKNSFSTFKEFFNDIKWAKIFKCIKSEMLKGELSFNYKHQDFSGYKNKDLILRNKDLMLFILDHHKVLKLNTSIIFQINNFYSNNSCPDFLNHEYFRINSIHVLNSFLHYGIFYHNLQNLKTLNYNFERKESFLFWRQFFSSHTFKKISYHLNDFKNILLILNDFFRLNNTEFDLLKKICWYHLLHSSYHDFKEIKEHKDFYISNDNFNFSNDLFIFFGFNKEIFNNNNIISNLLFELHCINSDFSNEKENILLKINDFGINHYPSIFNQDSEDRNNNILFKIVQLNHKEYLRENIAFLLNLNFDLSTQNDSGLNIVELIEEEIIKLKINQEDKRLKTLLDLKNYIIKYSLLKSLELN